MLIQTTVTFYDGGKMMWTILSEWGTAGESLYDCENVENFG